MRRVLVFGVALGALISASPATAQTTITCDPCSRPYQQWVDDAKIPTPEAVVDVREVFCRDTPSPTCMFPSEGAMYFPPTFWGADSRLIFFHELGHLFVYLHPMVGDATSERLADLYGLCAWPRWRVHKRHRIVEAPTGNTYRKATIRKTCEVFRTA